MDVHETLVAARNLIDREGWFHDGGTRGPGGSRCAGIALKDGAGLASWGDIASHSAFDRLYAAAGLDPHGDAIERRGRLAIWNDAPGRTKDEVLAAFDKAIAATAPAPDLSFEVRDTKAVMC